MTWTSENVRVREYHVPKTALYRYEILYPNALRVPKGLHTEVKEKGKGLCTERAKGTPKFEKFLWSWKGLERDRIMAERIY